MWTLLTPPLFIVFGLPFGMLECSKCSNSSKSSSQKERVKTGKENTFEAKMQQTIQTEE